MKVVWDDTAALKAIRGASVDACADAAEFLLEEANRTAPIEEAILIGSGTVVVDAAHNRAVVSYDTPYAVVQHEDLSFHHDPGRRGKWLELTFREQATRVARFFERRMKAKLR